MPKSNLYTRTGDKGLTSLVGGSRISKDSLRLEAYGTIDEFSSFLGAIAADPVCREEEKARILEVQNLLFNVGCYLATPVNKGAQPKAQNISDDDLSKLESWIDILDEQTPPVNTFILPGGSEIAAKTHIARTVCRRAERRILSLMAEEYVDPIILAYINRLSDYLFILARYFNFVEGVGELIWKK